LNNRNILILGALILGGAIILELYSNYANPFIDYTPGSFTNLLTESPQIFDYYKEGERIGNYTYTLTVEEGSPPLYTLITMIDVEYQGSKLKLNTTHTFFSAIKHVEYIVDTDLAGLKSYVECAFQGNSADIFTESQGRNQTTTLTLQPYTVIIDNNDPVHWELLKKSFVPEAGRQYKINVLVPQGAIIQTIEFGVDTARQFVKIGSKSYDCIVAREPNYEITLYFYEGNLIQYKNNPDGIVIVKKMS